MSTEADFHQSGRMFVAAGYRGHFYFWNLQADPPGRYVHFDACPVVERGSVRIHGQWTDLTNERVLRRTVDVENNGGADTVFVFTWVVIPNK
jgi:hypothetical protein